MIQRIQTIYLLIVTILGILLCIFPMAEVKDAAGVNILTLVVGDNIPYTVLVILMPLISFISIFLFKKRIIQMRVNSFNIVLTLLTMILCGIYIYLACTEGSSIKFEWPVVIMPINMILTYLAIRAIGKDEALVRSLDRLR